MDQLLTTRELMDLLKIDRTTVYRMLKEGRLAGVRVGGQWRFSKDQIGELLLTPVPPEKDSPVAITDVLPVHCIQPIQQVFAEIAQIGALTTSPSGEPLTTLSNSCRFCNLILQSPSGRAACVASWGGLAKQSERKPQFVTCHAGLKYARARIEINDELAAMVIGGQFYTQEPEPDEEAARIRRLAARHGIEENALAAAAGEIRVLEPRLEEQIGGWLQKVADTFEQVSRERAALVDRLHRISAMSTLPPE
ncbi:MAG TPA: PocR ligand-binding domain-containing protein [Bacteroidota bacterium]